PLSRQATRLRHPLVCPRPVRVHRHRRWRNQHRLIDATPCHVLMGGAAWSVRGGKTSSEGADCACSLVSSSTTILGIRLEAPLPNTHEIRATASGPDRGRSISTL